MNRSFSLHRDYLDREFEKLGIAKDERVLSDLAEKLFSEPVVTELPCLTADEENLLVFMLKSGEKGTFEQYVNNRSSSNIIYEGEQDISKNKNIYIKRRLFPDPETYRKTHPFFYMHRHARFFLPVVRLSSSIVNRKGKVRNELRLLRGLSDKKG